MTFRPFRISLLLLAALFLADALVAAPPVELTFRPDPAEGNPFARELWAEIHPPEGAKQLHPAFLRGDGLWAVRTRALTRGTYRLGEVTETGVVGAAPVAVEPVRETVEVDQVSTLAPVTIDPRRPREFVTRNGASYFPFGANFAWAQGDPDDYYPATFAAAREAGLNWARVWMAHWGRLNLDWRREEDGPSPAPGALDLTTADRWDRLVQAAEREGIRLQVVLQHHGQYSSRVNSNWDENPWNAERGGFLRTPQEFFTSPLAREITRHKFRYIVARWGYSPAILAWELFNEVKWTDARQGTPAENASVASWHAEMARHIRRFDTHGHLVTTSDDSLGHPLYDAMDYFQPHLYANNVLAGVRRFDRDPATLDRPIFYGEVGDDNMTALPAPLRDSGYSNLPIAWASLMGASPYPAQIWYVQRLLDREGLGGLAAISRFIEAAGLGRRPDLVPFSPAVAGGQTLPLVLEPGAHWHRMPPPTIQVPFDGSAPAELGELPRTLVWNGGPEPAAEPFPDAMTLELDYPRDATAVLRFAGASPEGGSARVVLDGTIVGDLVWTPRPEQEQLRSQPARELVLPMKAGRRTLTILNPQGPDWVEFDRLATGVEVPALAAVGRRADDLVVLWVYHRTGVWSAADLPVASATVQLADTAPGRWRVTWWDVEAGRPGVTTETDHAGGTLNLETPPIARHAAVWLEKLD